MSYNSEINNKLNLKNKKFLEKEIPKLTSNEHNEIFNIIRNNSSKYSENSRGVYINLKFLDNDTINKMIEFIEYSKNNKKNITNVVMNNSIKHRNRNRADIDKFTLDQKNIHKELDRLKHKNNDNFSFQSFLDKLSVTNIKEFSQNDNKIIYPTLKNSKAKFGGVKARLLKKCRDVNKSYQETPYLNNPDNVSYESDDSDCEYDDKNVNKLKNIIQNLGKSDSIDNVDNIDNISDDENEF